MQEYDITAEGDKFVAKIERIVHHEFDHDSEIEWLHNCIVVHNVGWFDMSCVRQVEREGFKLYSCEAQDNGKMQLHFEEAGNWP